MSLVGTLWSIGGHGQVRAADRAAGEAQAVERLRAGDLVDEVEVDVEEVGLALRRSDHVAVPHLLAQRLRHRSTSPRHCAVPFSGIAVPDWWDSTVSGVGVLDKAVGILEVLSDGRRRSLGDLVADTGLPRATAHRLVHALEAHGLAHLGAGRAVGARVAAGRAGRAAGERARPGQRQPRPALERLRDATGESVQLYVRRAGHRVCVVSLESPHSLRTIVAVGPVLPLDRGSGRHASCRVDADRAPSGAGPRASRSGRRAWRRSSAPVFHGRDVVAAVSVSGPGRSDVTRQPGRRWADDVVGCGPCGRPGRRRWA